MHGDGLFELKHNQRRSGCARHCLGPCQGCRNPIFASRGTMNISLPDSLKSFVDEQVANRGYGTGSECVRELIRVDRDRQRLRKLLLDGAASPAADEAYFPRPQASRSLRQGEVNKPVLQREQARRDCILQPKKPC
jgi:antitoxin ParD1/3/4